MKPPKELLDKINAAVEADQIAFKQAAADLNLTLSEGAIAGRRQGYFKGYLDASSELSRLRQENSKMRQDLTKIAGIARRFGKGSDPEKDIELIEKIAEENEQHNNT